MAAVIPAALTAIGASASTAATVGSVVNVGLTAASAFGAVQSGLAQSAALETQARQYEANARLEGLKGREQALALQNQLDADLASQNALFASRGTLQGEGSALAARNEAKKNASRDIDNARFNADIAALNAKQSASNARSNASSAKQSGLINAAGSLGGFQPIAGGIFSRL